MRPGSATAGTAFAAHGRPLLMPDEIRRLSEQQVIVLQQGQPPYLLQRLDYLRDPELAGLGDANPMYQAVGARPVVAPVGLRRPGDPEER
jgi:type IV secretory pathway TraG/TraD family ATPase VirD4